MCYAEPAVTRFVLAIAAVALAAPASGFAAPAAYASIELVGPAECCCAPEAEDDDGAARLEARCCCEFLPARRGVAGYDSAVAGSADLEPAAEPALLGQVQLAPATIARRPAAAARAPPPGGTTLYAQHTSHLL